MLFRIFQGKQYTVRAYVTADSDVLSFDKCFEIDRHDILPKPFQTRNGRTFTRTRLRVYESVVYRIQCEGHVTFAHLRKHLPTLFDLGIVRLLNSLSYLGENVEQIMALGSAIIGEERTREIVGKRLGIGRGQDHPSQNTQKFSSLCRKWLHSAQYKLLHSVHRNPEEAPHLLHTPSSQGSNGLRGQKK